MNAINHNSKRSVTMTPGNKVNAINDALVKWFHENKELQGEKPNLVMFYFFFKLNHD